MSGKCSARCSRSTSRIQRRSSAEAKRKRPSSSFWRVSGSAPAMSQRTARRSNRNSTARCQASSCESACRQRRGVLLPRGRRHRAAQHEQRRRPRRGTRTRRPQRSRRRSSSPAASARCVLAGESGPPTRRRRRGVTGVPLAVPHARARSARSGAASGCCPACGACGCRCRWPGVPHCNAWALRPATGSCWWTPGCTSRARWPTSSGRSTQAGQRLEDVRLIVLHARARRPLRPGHADRRARGLRGVDPPRPRALHAPPRPERRLERRLEVARQSGVPEAPLRRWAERRRGSRIGIAGHAALGPRPAPRRADRHRPRRRGGGRDARPRALARVPAPARAAAADLRRPPARPRLAVLRRRLHARSRGRVPAVAGQGRRARRPARAGRPRPAVHRRARPHRRPTARWSPSGSSAVRAALRRRPAARRTRSRRAIYGEAWTPRRSASLADSTLTRAWLRHLERARGASQRPPEWRGPAEHWTLRRA